jgi:hypothetical protein
MEQGRVREVYPDQGVIGDPAGILLPNESAAIESARRIIDDLGEERLPGEPKPTIVVVSDGREVVYRFPGG